MARSAAQRAAEKLQKEKSVPFSEKEENYTALLEAEAEKLGAQGDFEFSACASDCGHVFVTLFERKRVSGKRNAGKFLVWVCRSQRNSDDFCTCR